MHSLPKKLRLHGMRCAQVMVNRDGILTIKGERKFEVRCRLPYLPGLPSSAPGHSDQHSIRDFVMRMNCQPLLHGSHAPE
jgi:hypothetical protein